MGMGYIASYDGQVTPLEIGALVAGDLLVGNSSGTATRLPVGSNGQVLGMVAGAPAWMAPGAAGFPTFAQITTGTNTTATMTVGTGASIARSGSGTVSASDLLGSTWPTSFAVGDLLYASAANTLTKLADVAAGSVLVSGGVTTAPAWSASPSLTNLTVSTLTTLGVASTTTGQLRLYNTGSALATIIQAGSAAAAITYTWPTNKGTAGQVLYDAAGDGVLGWTTISSAPAFSAITSGTNTTAAMVLDTGASLTVSGSGTNNATSLLSATWAAPAAIGSTTPAAGSFTTLSATGAITASVNGAASTPAEILTGTWFTGGSATTTKPQLLVEPSGTTSTGWSTSGTGIGVNAASGFTGNLFDAQVNGVSIVKVTNTGTSSRLGGPFQVYANSAGNTSIGINAATSNNSGLDFLINGTIQGSIFGATTGIQIEARQGSGGLVNLSPKPNAAMAVAGTVQIGGQAAGSPFILATLDANMTGTASTEVNAIKWHLGAATTAFGTGALATQRFVLTTAPTISFAGASTVTNLVTSEIQSPNVSTNATATNTWGLRVGTSAGTFPSVAGWTYAAIGVPAHTITLSGSTQVTSVGAAALSLGQVTLTDASALTVDASATLYIAGAPVAAGSVTLTKAYSLWIDAGTPRIDSTSANGTTATVMSSLGPAGANTTIQEWLTIEINGTVRYIPCW